MGITCPEDNFWPGLCTQKGGWSLKIALPARACPLCWHILRKTQRGSQMDRRWAGGGTRPAYGEDFFRAASATPSDEEHPPTCWAAAAEGEGVHARHGVPAKQAAHLLPTEHTASFGERHRASSMTAEADDLMAETLEMGGRRRGLSSSCTRGLLRNLWQGISPLCFPSHSSYVLSVKPLNTLGRGTGS